MKNPKQIIIFKHPGTFLNPIITVTVFMMVTLSCKLTHPVGAKTDKPESPIQTPKIIFLNYSVKLNSSTKQYEVRLVDKIIVDGKLKISTSFPEIRKPGDLECVALDNKLVPVDSLVISDPLNITIESVDMNNALFKKEVARDSAQFSVRMQLSDKIHAFGIKKIFHSGIQDSYLLITKIRLP